jgi:hypothetical protein
LLFAAVSAQQQSPSTAPGEPRDIQEDIALWSTVVVGLRDVVVILIAIVALTILAVVALHHYSAASDAVSVIGAVGPSIATVAAAAFGISVGTAAGSAAGKANARAANKDVQQKRQQAANAKEQTAALRQQVASLAQRIAQAPSPAGARDFQIETGGAAPVTVSADELADVRAKLERVDATLDVISAS